VLINHPPIKPTKLIIFSFYSLPSAQGMMHISPSPIFVNNAMEGFMNKFQYQYACLMFYLG